MITQRGLDDHEDDIQTWHKKNVPKTKRNVKRMGPQHGSLFKNVCFYQ